MATYVIGDIQGCFHSFQNLLKAIRFDSQEDRLWLVGDIINRGTGSLETLRWVYDHQDSLVMVLGNHDLHTVAVAEGYVLQHKSDTLQPLLDAHDADQLLAWLRHQPLVHQSQDYLMVHAGFLPQWSVDDVICLAGEVETALTGPDHRGFLAGMYGNQPLQWQESLEGIDRLRLITNVMTRIRTCTAEGEMNFRFSGELQDIPAGYLPWFDMAGRKSAEATILFGHWSALGLHIRPNLYALDTGCLWGGKLTAMRLEDKAIYQVPCAAEDLPQKV